VSNQKFKVARKVKGIELRHLAQTQG